MVPVTVKQLNDEVQASDDKSSFVVDDVNVNVGFINFVSFFEV